MPETPTIRVQGVVCVLDGKPILRGVDAVLPAGKVTLLLGCNGSGKTMLLELLAGLRKPRSGHVYIGTESLWLGNKPNRNLLPVLGLAMQNPEDMLFGRTIREEFTYSLTPYRLPVARRGAVAERALARWLDGGIAGSGDDWLDRDPLALSGGQRRRLAMALTDAAEPDWLLLDEPTAGLDRPVLEQLRHRLAARRKAGKGTILVTHDPEELIHEADQVVLMREGRVIWSGTPEQLAARPQLFTQAGMALPDGLQLAEQLRAAGFSLPQGWPDANSLAESLAASRVVASGRAIETDTAEEPERPRDEWTTEQTDIACTAETDSTLAGTTATGHARTAAAPSTALIGSFDPRALWLSCLMVTAGIGMQTTWTGWLAGAIVSALCIRLSGLQARVWLRPAKALFLFALITSLAAGFQPAANIPFDTGLALATFQRFSKLVMMALLGFTLMAGISPMRLKLALERAMSPLAPFLPVGRLALAAALLLRFLPMLLAAWDRFARIAASRGKRPVKPGSVPLSLIAMTVVPFLLALIRLGDTLSAMLTVRGLGRADQSAPRKPAHDLAPVFARRDVWLCGSAALVLILFLIIEKTV